MDRLQKNKKFLVVLYAVNRDAKSTHILYLSRSTVTCVKNDFGKSKSTRSTNYSSKSKKVQALKFTFGVKVKSIFTESFCERQL